MPLLPYPVQPTPLSTRPQCSCKAEPSCYCVVDTSATAKSMAKVSDMISSARVWCEKVSDTAYLRMKNLAENVVLYIARAVVNENFEIVEPKNWFVKQM